MFSYVLAAYAHFLWEAEEEEDTVMQGHIQVSLVQGGTMTAVNAWIPNTADCRTTESGSNAA